MTQLPWPLSVRPSVRSTPDPIVYRGQYVMVKDDTP